MKNIFKNIAKITNIELYIISSRNQKDNQDLMNTLKLFLIDCDFKNPKIIFSKDDKF